MVFVNEAGQITFQVGKLDTDRFFKNVFQNSRVGLTVDAQDFLRLKKHQARPENRTLTAKNRS